MTVAASTTKPDGLKDALKRRAGWRWPAPPSGVPRRQGRERRGGLGCRGVRQQRPTVHVGLGRLAWEAHLD